MAPEGEDTPYRPKDAIGSTAKVAAGFGVVGLFAAAVQSARTKHNVGPFAAFTRYGGTIVTFTAVGGLYQFASTVSANLRQKDDSINAAIGGFFGGSALGLRAGRMPAVIGFGAAVAVIMGALDQSMGLQGKRATQDAEEFDRKEYLRKNRRRPLEETIAELGEGRSIRPPGYEERRRQRLKEKYGVEINPVRADNPIV